jgi:hypothetical protein
MRIYLYVVLVAAIATTGCEPDKNTNAVVTNSNRTANVARPEPPKPLEAPDPNFKACNPYYAVVPGSIAKFVVTYSSGLEADATVVVDRIDENGKTLFNERSQLVDRSGGLEINQNTERRLSCDGERIQVLFETNEVTLPTNRTRSEMKYRDNSILVPEPASLQRKGFTWQYAIRPAYVKDDAPAAVPDAPIIVTLESEGEVETTVPAGTFKAIKVRRKVGQNLSWDYLVEGIGLVKREAGEGTRWELREYSGLRAADRAR